jgi:hypothetical protein
VSQSFCIRPAQPAIVLSGSDTESLVLASSAHEGNQWYLNDSVIEGATSPTFNASQPGVYKVQVTVDDCVSDFSDGQTLIITGTEIHDDNMNAELYPNPAREWLRVSMGNHSGTKFISIVQANGKEAASQVVEGQEAEFRIANFASGLYVVKIKSGNRVKLLRFMKH